MSELSEDEIIERIEVRKLCRDEAGKADPLSRKKTGRR